MLDSFLLDTGLKASLIITLAWLMSFLLKRDRPDIARFFWVAVFTMLLALTLTWPLLPDLHLNLWPSATPVHHATPSAASVGTAGVVAPMATSFSWVDWALFFYLTGVSLFGLRLVLSYLLAWRLVRNSAAPEEAHFRDLAFDLAAEFKLEAPIDLRISKSNHSPLTLGWVRPKILLPVQAYDWDDERLRAVLLHEIAHIRGADYPIMLMMRVLTAVFWFNPLFWLAQRELIKACEHSGDAFVVASGMKASRYADHLLQIARGLRHQSGGMVPAMARISELEGRLMAVLDASLPHDQRFSALRGMILAVVMFGGTLLGNLNPWGDPHQQPGLMGVIEGEALELVVDLRTTCMFANQTLNRDPDQAQNIELDSQRYFIQDEDCANNLQHIPSARLALDPLTGEAVDKATAVIAKYPSNPNIVYFASEANLNAFNSSR
jgi:beta-lactamase regulating signal transducer with metallopeptidase domain